MQRFTALLQPITALLQRFTALLHVLPRCVLPRCCNLLPRC